MAAPALAEVAGGRGVAVNIRGIMVGWEREFELDGADGDRNHLLGR
jgi:hypothetical protein